MLLTCIEEFKIGLSVSLREEVCLLLFQRYANDTILSHVRQHTVDEVALTVGHFVTAEKWVISTDLGQAVALVGRCKQVVDGYGLSH